jgi:hypothetical protein
LTASPYRSLAILQEVPNVLSGKLGVLSRFAVLPAPKTLIWGNPETSIAGREQTWNSAAREVLTRGRLPRNGANAIETKQAELRAQPQITVRRLRH